MIDRDDTAAQPGVTPSRWVHVVTFAATAVSCYVAITQWHDLTKDIATAFSTYALFITIWGVLIAILEVFRAQSVSSVARAAALRAEQNTRIPYDVRDVTECASMIQSAIFGIQHEVGPRAQPLPRIIWLYTAIFEEKYDDPTSDQRRRIGIMQTYVGRKSLSKTDRLFAKTLGEMLSDLAAKGANIKVRAI